MLNNSKSILAKLLASENINVEHRKTKTAYFDLKSRTLVCPIWKDMTSELYDLLMGHEVGHALNTPPKGWHNAITEHQHAKIFKGYLNVLEDARIEKKMKEQYPGLKPSFFKAYQQLYNQDFFGVKEYFGEKEMRLSMLPFIDRINLHFKLGPFMNIKFTEDESVYIPRIEKLETWEEVETLAKELFNKALVESKTSNHYDTEDGSFGNGDDDDAEFDENEFQMEPPNYDVESITDAAFREKENEFISEKSLPYVYMNLPTANLNRIIVPYKKIHAHFNSVYSTIAEAANLKDVIYKDFLNDNRKIISYLVKEFELRKNAKQFSRAATAKTGELDIKKVFAYKYNEDLFKRMTIVPKGKSHGMIMFIDMSGSMIDSIKETIEQTIILAMFCRKVNIPFKVFGFSDNDSSHLAFFNSYHKYEEFKFSKRNKDYAALDNNFHLKEYLSSKMTNMEFVDAMKNWLLISECYLHRMSRFKDYIKDIEKRIEASYNLSIPDSEELKNTPLNEAIIAAFDIVNQIRNEYKLDIVNTIFLTDGESNCSNSIVDNQGWSKYNTSWHPHECNVNIVIKDTKTNKSVHVPPNVYLTQGLLSLLKEVTKANTIGFFIVGKSIKRHIEYTMKRSGLSFDDNSYKKFNKQKFLNVKTLGYNEYYFIPGGEALSVKNTDDIEELNTATSKREIKSAFIKMQQNKLINRVLLSRFIAEIS